jgi:hypothetical protein
MAELDLFISYTGKDRPWAVWLDFVLREAGYHTAPPPSCYRHLGAEPWSEPSTGWNSPQQLGDAAADDEPYSRGRAPLPPRYCNRQSELRPEPSKRREDPEQPGDAAVRNKPRSRGRAVFGAPPTSETFGASHATNSRAPLPNPQTSVSFWGVPRNKFRPLADRQECRFLVPSFLVAATS